MEKLSFNVCYISAHNYIEDLWQGYRFEQFRYSNMNPFVSNVWSFSVLILVDMNIVHQKWNINKKFAMFFFIGFYSYHFWYYCNIKIVLLRLTFIVNLNCFGMSNFFRVTVTILCICATAMDLLIAYKSGLKVYADRFFILT